MAVNAGQVTRDMNLVAESLERIIAASSKTTGELKVLIDVFEGLTGSKFKQFEHLSGSMDKFIETLKDAGQETGELENKIANVERAALRLQEAGRMQFGFGPGANMAREAGSIDDLFKRMLKLARKAGATKDSIKDISTELDALQERGKVEGGVIRLLNKMQKDGRITVEVFKSMTRSARLYLSALKKIEAVEIGKDPVDSTGGGGGTKLDEEPIGKRLSENRELYEKILPGGKRAIDNVEKSLKQMGLTLDDLGDITEDSAREIVRWTASVETKAGITKRAVITTTRWGQSLKSNSRNLKTFGGAIVSNIAKVAQWTVAIAIVYAPMRKLTELMQQAIEIESKLADVQIALASGTESLDKVWKESTVIARELGVSVEGVIDGYVLAVRATANIIAPAEKAAATTAVLKDSMILAKLAGIDQAIAMDTLVGALRQLNIPLTDGAALIDKWVAVSKAANVSLHTLAESFAITATAAENVGLTMDELNGFIAAVAEVTTLSATESGNAVRAFISGFQTDQAERELDKFGISVKTVNGELKAFTTVIEDIIERKDVGLISDKELAKISEIIGGGARRGAQVNAFLENYSRVQELAAISANASGDAAEAMAIKIETLKSALENLNTAFGELAKALGTDAGLLDLMRSGVDRMSKWVDGVTDLIQILGKATPAILAFAAAWYALKKSTQAQSMLDMEMDDLLLGGFDPERKFRRLRKLLAKSSQDRFGKDFTAREAIGGFGGIGGGAVGGAAIGLGTALAAGNADLKRAGTTMGGAAISQMIAGGSPVGGLIGASIVTALWSNLVDREADLVNIWTKIFTGAFDEGTATVVEDREKGDIFKEVKDLIGGQDIGGLITGIGAAGLAYSTPGSIMDILKPSQEDIEKSTVSIMDSIIAVAEGRANLSQKIVTGMFWNKREIEEMYPEIKAALKEMQDLAIETVEGDPTRTTSPFGMRLLGISEDMGPQASAVLQKVREDMLRDVARGDVGVRELTELLNIGDFELQVSTVVAGMTALGAAGMDYIAVAETLSAGSEQEGLIIKQLANEIGTLENEYRELEAAYGDYIDQAGRLDLGEIESQIRGIQGTLLEYTTVMREGQRYKDFEAPTLVGVSPEATRRQLQQAVHEARTMTNEALDSMELKGPERQKVIDSYGELALQSVETFKVVLGDIEGVSQEILDSVLDNMGIAASAMDKTMGFQQVDLEAKDLPQLYGNIQYYQQLLEPTGYLDTQDLEDIVLLTSDHEVDAVTTYGILMNLALQDLIDINEQQLEGIFNIPEGVTAQIPFTGKLYFSDQPIPDAGGSGIKKLGDAVDSLTGETGKGLTLSQQQIDALQALLIISGGSETFLSNIEGLLREAGVEPKERGPVQEAVTLDEAIATDIADNNTAQATEMAEAFAAALSQSEQINPELRLHRLFQEGGGFTKTEPEFEAGFGGEFWGDAADAISGAISETFQGLIDLFSGALGIETGLGGTTSGISSEQVLAALPQSIPVNIQTRITNPVTVLLDGYQIASSLNERNYEDLQSATRRQGAVGYIMEA